MDKHKNTLIAQENEYILALIEEALNKHGQFFSTDEELLDFSIKNCERKILDNEGSFILTYEGKEILKINKSINFTLNYRGAVIRIELTHEFM